MSEPVNIRAIRNGYQSAWRAYLLGDYDLCLSLTAGMADERARFLEARILLRLGRSDEVLQLLRFEAEDEGQRRRLMGTALGRCGMFEIAAQELQAAREIAKTAQDRAQTDFFLALHEWMLGNADAADFILPRHGVDPYLAVMIEDLRGWIAASRCDFKVALQRFMQAFEAERARGDEADRYTLVRLAYAALSIARELAHVPIAGEIEAALDGITWTSAMEVSRFHILRYLAWTVAIEGNYSETFRHLRRARDIAPSPAWRVSILCEMAYLSLSVGGRLWSDTLADEACDIAQSVDWAAMQHDERKGLLLLAQIETNRDPVSAKAYLEAYDALPDPPPMISRDVRDIALEAFIRGCVHHVNGDNIAASILYAQAFEIYERIGFQWRAILCALARGEATHRREYFEYAALHLRMFPNSWLRARIADAIAVYENPVSVRFTPAQLEVLQGLCQGKTDRAIGEMTGRSASTVRDHLKEIRKITGTKNRSELVAYCARTGIMIDLGHRTQQNADR